MKSILLLLLLPLAFPCVCLETGYASWYGVKFHGRTTASGEIYDMYKLTAAHKTLPFGTYVKVVNIENGKSIIVKINDRGPFIKGRIIDLSKAAAEKLDMMKNGVAKVTIEIMTAEEKAENGICAIQIGSYAKKENAEQIHQLLVNKGFKAVMEKTEQGYIRVIIRNVLKKELYIVLAALKEFGFIDVLIKEN